MIWIPTLVVAWSHQHYDCSYFLGTEIDPSLDRTPKLLLESPYRSAGAPEGVTFQLLRKSCHLEFVLVSESNSRASYGASCTPEALRPHRGDKVSE